MSRYKPLQVVGLELEYAVVDADMSPACLVEDAFRHIHGRRTSAVEYGGVGFSNEFAAHVFEIKTLEPMASLAEAENQLFQGLRAFAQVLKDKFSARLLPTGMHPLMRPAETGLWRRAGRRIYETYAKLFPVIDHGWLNVQSSHVNLPCGSEAESVAQHNAVSCILPYLPALSASSPICEGRLTGALDTRLRFYNENQRRIPVISGDVIPEFIDSHADYRRRIFQPISRALDGLEGAEILRPEWVNSRGAIMRFSRDALEIKILDAQECVRMDVAVAVFIRALLRGLIPRLLAGQLELPPHAQLVSDYQQVIRLGSTARVAAPHLLPSPQADEHVSARRVLEALQEVARGHAIQGEHGYLDLIEGRIEKGCLAERIVEALRERAADSDGGFSRQDVVDVYGELADSLARNEPWLL